MKVWESIYEAYSMEKLSLSPVNFQKIRDKLRAFAEEFVQNPKDREYFEELISFLCFELEKSHFHAGIMEALRLLSE